VPYYDRELFYMRILLLHVRGKTSFVDLRTVDDVVYPTFCEAAQASNLCADDREWTRCLEEAEATAMAPQIRQMFVYICTFCEAQNTNSLWLRFRDAMSDDFMRRFPDIGREAARNIALHYVRNMLARNGQRLETFVLEEPTPMADVAHLQALVNAGELLFNPQVCIKT